MGDFTLNSNRKSRRISCVIVHSNKMDQIIVKQAKNKKNPSEIFLISLQFAEDLVSVRSDFGEQLDQQLKQLITEFADVTEELQGPLPHRGHLDHKVKLTGYPPRQRSEAPHRFFDTSIRLMYQENRRIDSNRY